MSTNKKEILNIVLSDYKSGVWLFNKFCNETFAVGNRTTLTVTLPDRIERIEVYKEYHDILGLKVDHVRVWLHGSIYNESNSVQPI